MTESAAGRGMLRAWSVVLILLVTYVLSNVDRNIISLLVTPIRRELEISDTEMSYLIGGGFAVFYVTASIPLGQLADRVNRVRMIVIGLIFWSLATVACGLAGSYATLFVARICVGVGEAVLSPCAMSIIADTMPREKLGRAVSLFAAGAPIGTGVALIGGGSVIALSQGNPIDLPLVGELTPWRAIFVMLLVPTLIVLPLLAFVREPPRRATGLHEPVRPTFGDAFRFLRANPGVWFTILGLAVVTTAAQGSFPWLPSFLERTYQVEVHEVSGQLGVIAVVSGITGLLAGGAIADALFRRGKLDAHIWVAMTAAFALAPLMVAVMAAPTVEWALAGLAVMIVVAQVPPGVATAALQMVAPARLRGILAAVNLLMAGLGSIAVGPTLIAWINDYVVGDDSGLRYAIATISILAPLAGLLFVRARRPYRERMRAILDNEASVS